MKSLIDYLELSGAALPGPKSADSNTAAVAGELRSFDVPEQAAEKFAVEALAMISAPDFIGEFSAKIGEPKAGETKEQFVARCKGLAAGILESRLK